MGKSSNRKISLDITGFDRSTIIWQVRSAYRQGYDEILIHYKNLETPHLRKSDRLLVRDVVRDQVVRLLGGKMVATDAHNCKLLVAHSKDENLQEIIKRVLQKLVELHSELILLVRGHLYAAALIEEKHDTLTKLASYCQRKLSIKPNQQATIEFLIISWADKIADIIKYVERDYITVQKPMSRTAITILESVHKCLELYESTYKQYSAAAVTNFSLRRDDTKRHIRDSIKNLDDQEAFILGQSTCILEILIDMMEGRMALEGL
jgi:hypothetical protein